MATKKQLWRWSFPAFFILNIMGSTMAIYAGNIQVGRYLSVSEKPLKNQQHLLQQRIDIHFPQK